MAFYHERAAFYSEKKTVFGHLFDFRYFYSFVAFYHERAAFYSEGLEITVKTVSSQKKIHTMVLASK